MWLIWNKENKFEFEARRRRNKNKKIGREREREGAEGLRRIKGKRCWCIVLKKKGDSNHDISAYILPFLPRYLRAKSAGEYSRTQLYFIIDGIRDAYKSSSCLTVNHAAVY